MVVVAPTARGRHLSAAFLYLCFYAVHQMQVITLKKEKKKMVAGRKERRIIIEGINKGEKLGLGKRFTFLFFLFFF